MANSAGAYDFELFEEKEYVRAAGSTAAAPLRRYSTRNDTGAVRTARHSKSENVITPPQKTWKNAGRRRIHPFRALMWAVCFCAIMGLVVSMVYGQVQLTELTNNVNAEVTLLNEANTMEIYLNTKTLSQYDLSEVERYATQSLGMSKISESQITYVNLADEDVGTVLLETETSGLTSLLNTIKSWFA